MKTSTQFVRFRKYILYGTNLHDSLKVLFEIIQIIKGSGSHLQSQNMRQ